MSIKQRLMFIIVSTSAIALLLASAAFITYDLVTFRQEMRTEFTLLADVSGANSQSALSFEDADTAAEVLSALRVNQHIILGALYRLAPNHQEQGEGLGLTIALRTMDKLNGHLSVESKAGKGSQFFVRLSGPISSRILDHYRGEISCKMKS